MSTTITVMPNQSMNDVIIMAAGTMEAGMQFCQDNNVSISDVPAVGTVFQVSDAALVLGDPGTMQYITQNSIVIGTLDRGPDLGFQVILYPVMKGVAHLPAPGIPSVAGKWIFDIAADTGFIAVYGLPDSVFPSEPNVMSYEHFDDILAQILLPSAIHDIGGDSMISELITYAIPYSAGSSHLYVWNNEQQPCIQFQDNNGNLAQSTPMIVLPADGQTPIDSFQPELLVERITSDDSTITLRLTKSHASIALTEIASFAFGFTDEASTGIPDPDDPTNINKCIVAAGVGMHTFGVGGTYFDVNSFVIGQSLIQCIVEVS